MQFLKIGTKLPKMVEICPKSHEIAQNDKKGPTVIKQWPTMLTNLVHFETFIGPF